jgi:hypothetical protein
MAIDTGDDVVQAMKDLWVNGHVGMRNIKRSLNDEIDLLKALKDIPDYATTASTAQKAKVNAMIAALQTMKALITDDMLDKKL